MRFATPNMILSLVMLVTHTLAIPPEQWDHTVHGGKDDTGKCSTTLLMNNAIVFRGKNLVWGETFLNEREGLVVSSAAYRIACNGRCCVYFKWKGVSDWTEVTLTSDQHEAVRLDALQLLGCGNKEKGLINGVGRFMRGTPDEHNVCIGNLNAAHDCFGDVGDSS